MSFSLFYALKFLEKIDVDHSRDFKSKIVANDRGHSKQEFTIVLVTRSSNTNR